MVTGTRDQVQQGNMFEVNGYDQVKQNFEDIKKMGRTKYFYFPSIIVCAFVNGIVCSRVRKVLHSR